MYLYLYLKYIFDVSYPALKASSVCPSSWVFWPQMMPHR